jgi:two-component system, cell cycle sensor histidine kinase and response regulator CckA
LARVSGSTTSTGSKGAEKIYGWSADEVIGKNAEPLLFKDSSGQFETARRSIIQNGEWKGEIHHARRNGSEITVESRWTLVRDEQGDPKSILIINTDD